MKIWTLLEWTISSLKEFQILTQDGKKDRENCSVEQRIGVNDNVLRLTVRLVLRIGLKSNGNLLCSGWDWFCTILKKRERDPTLRRWSKLMLISGNKKRIIPNTRSKRRKWQTAAELHTGAQYSKNGKINEKKHWRTIVLHS